MDEGQSGNLFEELGDRSSEPLAARMRPRTLDEFVGQDQVLGPGKMLRSLIERDEIRSAIFFGPPGCGKSTLAMLIARSTKAHFDVFSAVTSGIADVRKAMDAARQRLQYHGERTILFVDEIHRFNKAQQDAFLPYVEDGTIVLIGATTQNPYFDVIGPLLSRSRLFKFESLSQQALEGLLNRAIEDPARGLGRMRLEVEPEALAHLALAAAGDARFALTALEWAALVAEEDAEGRRHVSLEAAEEAVQRRVLAYDKGGDQHYDTISAFIKSLRGSDPDAAVYWLVRMVEAGEDPRFLMRRMVVHAAEDVGLADPQALVLASAAAHALELVGLPEALIPMTEAALYIATAPKSNAVVEAIARVRADLQTQAHGEVPKHLRDTSYQGAKKMGHGAGYKYPHRYPGAYVEQRYLPEGLPTRPYYEPKGEGHEARVLQRMRARKQGPPPEEEEKPPQQS